jgi:archaellum component FlaG (FlaF/FlaG flagellin family)
MAFSAVACGGSGDKKAACSKMQQTIAEVSRKGMTQISDPNALAQTYANGANTIRQQAKDSGDDKVESAGTDVAAALDKLGTQVKNLTSGGTPQMPDTASLTNAGTRLKTACDG